MRDASHKTIVKVPVIMQMEVLECGAACLAMVLAYYGKWLPLEEVRHACNVSRDGSKAGNIIRAAQNFGLEAHGFSSSLEALKTKPLPAIIFWNFKHFVVFKGFKHWGTKRCKALINDPAQGAIEVDFDTFDKSFTGIVLTFEPTEEFKAEGTPTSVFRYFGASFKKHFPQIVVIGLSGILMACVSAATPGFSRVFMDSILAGTNPEWLPGFLIALVCLLLFSTVVSTVNILFTLKTNGMLAVESNTKFVRHVLCLPIEFFSQRYAGDIVARQASNEVIQRTLMQTLAPLALNLVMTLLYIAVMLNYSVPLSCVGFAAIAVDILMTRIVGKRRLNITRAKQADSGKLFATTVNGIEMIETVKAAGAENSWFERWSGIAARVSNADTRFARVEASLGSVASLVQALANIAVLLLGVLFIIEGQLTSGMLLAFQGFMGTMMGPMMALTSSGQQMQEIRAQIERVDDVMRYPVDVEFVSTANRPDGAPEKLGGKIEFSHIDFGYSPLSPPFIKDFSLSVLPGHKIAVVGASGCGKSTIAKLVAGLEKPWSGEILFDGLPACDINRSVFVSSLAMVDQDILFFEGTVSENIRLWDDTISDEDVISAAKCACIHDEIIERESGYQTVLAENGKNFSGGQCQRMEIARALAGRPSILVLDEATSALDALVENAIVTNVCSRGITCIIIAHRLSTIRDCDEILVMQEGAVVERGTHDELLKKCCLYEQLITNE